MVTGINQCIYEINNEKKWVHVQHNYNKPEEGNSIVRLTAMSETRYLRVWYKFLVLLWSCIRLYATEPMVKGVEIYETNLLLFYVNCITIYPVRVISNSTEYEKGVR